MKSIAEVLRKLRKLLCKPLISLRRFCVRNPLYIFDIDAAASAARRLERIGFWKRELTKAKPTGRLASRLISDVMEL
jgi:hypothetical protein